MLQRGRERNPIGEHSLFCLTIATPAEVHVAIPVVIIALPCGAGEEAKYNSEYSVSSKMGSVLTSSA